MATNESNVSILKNFIFKIAEQAYTSNDTFNSVKAGIVEEHLNGKYKVKLDNSDTLIEATLFYSNEQINQNDYVYLIEAFTENNSNFIKYFIFGKVSDVNTEIGKSDWSRFIEAGGSGTKSSEWTWGKICTTPLIYDSSEDHKNFIDSINQNGYFAIYGDFACTSENLKEYGLNITLTYEGGSPFIYKFSSQDFIGQPFNMSSVITQKKIFKIAKNITSISIQGFVDGGSATISLKNLTIIAGSLYMLDPNIEVKIAAAAGTKDYLVGADQEQIELQAKISQNGQNIFSNLINYIWYINDPNKSDTDEGYWTCLNGDPIDEILTDAFGNSITIPVIRGKAANLILYRGTEPTVSTDEADKYLVKDFDDNDNFNRKIKCEITYEGTSIESNIFDLWDYKYEDYDVRIDSNIRPVTFYAGDDIDNPIELTAVKIGGPEKNGPKHDFKFKWSYASGSVGKIYKVTKNNSTNDIEEIEVDANDDIFKEKTIVLYLSQGSYETGSQFIDKYVIKETVKLQCELFINDETNSRGDADQEIRVAQDQETIIETHYQYYIAGGTQDNSGWNGVTFEKGFRTFSETVNDSIWYGEWNIIDKNNSNAIWIQNELAKVEWECTNESVTSDTTEFNYNYKYTKGAANEQALKKILDTVLSPHQAIYVTNRRVWLEKQSDTYFLVGRQEEWAYPQILKATKGDLDEDGKPKKLTQEALDKLNVFNSLTAGGRDQGMFFEDVYILTKDTTAQSGKDYYEKQYNESGESFTYIKQEIVTGNPKEQFLYELKEDQVYINAEYIQTGALRVGDPEQGHIFYADIDQPKVEIGGFTVDKDTLKTNDYQYQEILISDYYQGDYDIIKNAQERSGEDEGLNFGTGSISDYTFFTDDIETAFLYLPDGDSLSSSQLTDKNTTLTTLVIPKSYSNIVSLGLDKFDNLEYIMFLGQLRNISTNYGSDNTTTKLKVFYDNTSFTDGTDIVESIKSKYPLGTRFYDLKDGAWQWEQKATDGFAFSSDQNENMIDSKYFKVSHDGDLFSNSGKIGGFEIGENYLRSDNYKFSPPSELKTISQNRKELTYYSDKNTSDGLFFQGVYEINLNIYDFNIDKKRPINIGNVICLDGQIDTEINENNYRVINKQVVFQEDLNILKIQIDFYIRPGYGTKFKCNFDISLYSKDETLGFQLSSDPTENMINSQYFKVSHQGEIEVTSGKIASWVLDSTKFYSNTVDDTTGHSVNGVGMSSNANPEDPAFWAGYNGPGKAPSEFLATEDLKYAGWEDATSFFVAHNGKCVAKNMQIIGQASPSDSLLINCMNDDRVSIFSVSQGGEVHASKITIQGDGSSKDSIITAGDFSLYSNGQLVVGDVQLYSKNAICYLWSNTHQGGISIGPNTTPTYTSTKLILNFTKGSSIEGDYWTVTATLQTGTAVAIKTSYTLYFEWYWKLAGSEGGTWKIAGEGDGAARGSVTITLNPGEANKEITVCKRNKLVNGAYQGLNIYRSRVNSTGKAFRLIHCGDLTDYTPTTNDYNTYYDDRFETQTFSDLNQVPAQVNKRTAVCISDNLFPGSDSSQIGAEGNKWAQIHGTQIYGTLMDTSTMKASQASYEADPIDSSDRNKKYNIQPIADIYSQLFDKLVPSTFGFVNGTSGRTHLGLIAQGVKDSMDEIGLSDKDCAIYCSWLEENGEETCGLRYGELTALNIYEIQKLKKRESELENKVALLEQKIKEIKGEI